MSPAVKINPSILAADVGHLHDACVQVEQMGGDEVHIDLMDGHFVPNLSFSPSVVSMARNAVDIPLNVHLMLTNPDKYVDMFCEAGASTLLIHIEPDYDHADTLKRIRNHGVRPGIVLNPDTELSDIDPVLDLVDEVLFMTVFPGFGGQSFLEDPLPRIRALRDQRPGMNIQVDGGINRDTAQRCFEYGANSFAMGSSLFKAEDMASEIRMLRDLLS